MPVEERFPRPSVMGVVNVTPDSFSDGGVNYDTADAVASARRMAADGAALVDIGGESTRPGSEGVSTEEELRRVLPVLEAVRGELSVSIDTAKAEVARRAIDLGAELVNDVTALRGRRGRPRGAHRTRPGNRVRQDGPAQLRARAATGRPALAGAPGRDRLLAEAIARSAARRP